MPLSTIPEVERVYGSQLATIPNVPGNALRNTNTNEMDPARSSTDAAEYADLWPKMSINLAMEILETGTWDDIEVTPVQRKVAYDYMMMHPPKHKQAQLEEC